MNPPKKPNELGIDKATLRREVSRAVAEEKAREMGVDADDLVQTVVDGRTIWVKRDRVAVSLEKRAKLRSKVKVQRALRGGDESIVGDIDSRIQACENLIEDLSKRDALDAMERHDIRRIVSTIVKRVDTQVRELSEVEDRIEARKAKDPVIQDLERVTKAIKQAKESGDEETVRKLAIQQSEGLQNLQSWRRSIQPDLDTAMRCRIALQLDQRRVYRLHGDFTRRLVEAMIPEAGGDAAAGRRDQEALASALEDFSICVARWQDSDVASASVGKLKAMDVRKQSATLDQERETLLALLDGLDRCLAELRCPEEPSSDGTPLLE